MTDRLQDEAFRKFKCYKDKRSGELVTSFRQEESIMKKRGQAYMRDGAKLEPRLREIAERHAWKVRKGLVK